MARCPSFRLSMDAMRATLAGPAVARDDALGRVRRRMSRDPVFQRTSGFDALYGLEVLEVSDDLVRAEVAVRDELHQPFGLVHGGVLASIAETLASVGTLAVVFPEGNAAMGSANHTSFLRPIVDGTIHARALRRHRGRTTWVWDV